MYGEHGCVSGGMCLVWVRTHKNLYVCVCMCVKVCTPILVYLEGYGRCLWSGVHTSQSTRVFRVWVCSMWRHVYVKGCICKCESVFCKRKEFPHVHCAA